MHGNEPVKTAGMRQRLAAAAIATALAGPAVAMGVVLAGIEAYRLVQPEAPLFGGPRPATLAESIIDGFGVEQSFQFIRAGQDPNALLRIDDEDYTGGLTMEVSPLMLAVAAGDGSAVRMLLSFGARLDLPQNRHAECLAREMRNREIETILIDQRDEGSPEPPCEDRRAGAPTPLVAWANTANDAHAPDRR